jgi:dTDP-4-amino-4,6-dideoxygalactose transaminase
VGSSQALAVNSGTAGLHLALAALGIGPGDEVITTPLTFCSTVNTILQVGAKAVLADIACDGNIDPDQVASHITERTRAIIPVHMGGLPCHMDAIWALARRFSLAVVEDAAHAVGSHYRGSPIGSDNPSAGHRSDAVVFSFYATKNLTTGEGGMVTTHNESLTKRMRILCLHGISKDAWDRYTEKGNWYYEVVACGFKYNLSDLQSAIGIHQLRKQEQFVASRTRLARRYHRAFADMAELELPPDRTSCRHSWHLYAIRLNLSHLGIGRDEFIKELRLKNIGTSVHFIPIPLHPYFRSCSRLAHGPCTQALTLYSRLVSLPLYPTMTDEQIDYVVASVKNIVHAAKAKKAVAVPAY